MRRTSTDFKIEKWRDKAKDRRLQNEYLKRRIKELSHSRDLWKEKYKSCRLELLSLKKGLSRAASDRQVKPQRYHYPIFVIGLSLWFRQQGRCSLRTCSQILSELLVYLSLDIGSPCATTIQYWEQKMGYYQLTQRPDPESRWVIILDESISVGQSKLLLTLGVDVSSYDFSHALTHADISTLDLAVASSWKGADIADRIHGLKERGYQIEYGLSDQGNNLIKAFKISEITQISDCTHALSKAVEKCYKKEETFIEFSKECVAFKRKVVLSEMAFLMPPAQKSKARFLNLHSLSRWAIKAMAFYQRIKKKKLYIPIQEQLQWMVKYRGFIQQLDQVCQTIRRIFAILKPKGLDQITVAKCLKILAHSQTPSSFKIYIEQYLWQTLEKAKPFQKVIASSDIIESTFGKFKHRKPSNPILGITAGCLAIPGYGQKFPPKVIKQAMENTPIRLIEKWKKENLTNPLANKWNLSLTKVQ